MLARERRAPARNRRRQLRLAQPREPRGPRHRPRQRESPPAPVTAPRRSSRVAGLRQVDYRPPPDDLRDLHIGEALLPCPAQLRRAYTALTRGPRRTRLGESTLPASLRIRGAPIGRGLFAATPIAKGCMVDIYEETDTEHPEYRIQRGPPGEARYGRPHPERCTLGFAQFANHGGDASNTALVSVLPARAKRVVYCLVSTTTIAAGTEILFDYGPAMEVCIHERYNRRG